LITSHQRGHLIKYVGYWVYADNDETIENERPCKQCGKPPTIKGYDACLGYIPNANYACCGHGLGGNYEYRI